MLLILADRCPHCDFAAILDPQDKVMSCQNSSCQKVDSSYCSILSNSGSAARSMECSKFSCALKNALLRCLQETCRHCKADWEEHFGKQCKEIEKQDETQLRLKL